MWGNEDMDDWASENYDEHFQSSELSDNFDDNDDLLDIEDIDFSNISGSTRKERLKKISRQTSTAKIVPKKKKD